MPSSRARARQSGQVRILTSSGEIAVRGARRSDQPELQRQVIAWTHRVRNRAHWATSNEMTGDLDTAARRFLELVGISEVQRRQIAESGFVEIAVAFQSEELGWEWRILPWEFVLSAGTRDLRTGPLLITRSLDVRGRARPSAYRSIVFVESAPGRLAQEWDFEDERRLVKRYARAVKFERIESPTAPQLSAAIARHKPDIVHLAGFDAHQGLDLIEHAGRTEPLDGYLVASDGGVAAVTAQELGALLTPGQHTPSLVVCNIWNSAARVAPLLVAAGVRAVLGFQDSIDDALAEMFLGSFYRALAETKDVNVAFRDAWQPLLAQSKSLRGTGIVLWQRSARPVRARVGRTRQEPARDATFLDPARLSLGKARELVAVTAEPYGLISYGLLHNNRDIFQKFVVRNLSDAARLSGLQVFVELHSNEGTYPFRRSFDIDGPVYDLQRDVRIALTSQLARSVDEVMRTSLFVRVSWGPHEVFAETYPVTMAPVDQWVDTDDDRVFLPSYVFPRGKAVATIVKNAEHYVTALRDDPTAGFDGYQAINPDLPNPAQNVDRQVQALWYSVVYRVPASYINPPPTYAIASQRIRTPDEIVAGGFGTCIDVALLFASCLESIEIYPVIFILEDHAFPGFWRTESARQDFVRRVSSAASREVSAREALHGGRTGARRSAVPPWCFGKEDFAEIKRAIDRHQLVPLETVGLTARSSLGQSIAEAKEYFEPDESGRFLVMLDVTTARENQVTPLPLGARLG